MKPLLALVLVLSACQDRTASPDLAQRAAALQAGMSTDTLMVDGAPVVIKFHEFTGGPSFPMPFAVRYPEGMAVTAERAALGDVVRLTQNADTVAGTWSLTFLPAGTAEDDARQTAMAAASRLAAATPDSMASTILSQTGAMSRVWLGQHAGRYILVQSSAGDAAAWSAFEPHAAYVEQNWTWTDDGAALAG